MQMYNPVLAWANQRFDVKFVVDNSIFGAAQQPETHQAVRHFLQGMQLRTPRSLMLAVRRCLMSYLRLCKYLGISLALTVTCRCWQPLQP